MKILTKEIRRHTQGFTDIIDLTEDLAEILQKSQLKEGAALLFAVGSTAGLTTIEYEPGLIKDLKDFFEKIVPQKATYAHDATWGDANGFSHLRASLLKSSLTIPFTDRKFVLGTWQQVVLVDFDNNPRERRVVVQLQGE